MSEQDKIQRTVLPIPDQPHVGLTTYDAKDPETKYPPIRLAGRRAERGRVEPLLTGRNHHSAGMGAITEMATSAPGQCSFMSNTISPIARTLKLNGYSTSQFGKCHEVPVWETSPMGPFDAWPTGGGGFEYFFATKSNRDGNQGGMQ